MNKLSAFIIVIFLLLGSAMWFLADGALNQYLQVQISQNGIKATGFKTTVDTVETQTSTHTGTITGISIHLDNKNAIAFDNIVYQLDASTLKKSPLVIESLIISSPQYTISSSLYHKMANNLLNNLSQYRQNLSKKKPIDNKKHFPKMVIKSVLLVGADSPLMVNVGGELGLPANQLFSQVILDVLKHTKITEQAQL